jgi:hypothetical protein
LPSLPSSPSSPQLAPHNPAKAGCSTVCEVLASSVENDGPSSDGKHW